MMITFDFCSEILILFWFLIIVFNYNTTSLHYIGKHQNLNIPTENKYTALNSILTSDTSYIFFGISHETYNTGKSLEFVNFNASIKTIN